METEYVVTLSCFRDILGTQNMLLCCHVSGTSWGHRICCCVVMFQGQLGDTEYMAAFQQIVMPIVYEVRYHVGFIHMAYLSLS